MPVVLRRVRLFLLPAGLAACAAGSRGPTLPAALIEAEEIRRREVALVDFEQHQDRLDRIAHPLLARATPLCPAAVGYRLGMRLATLQDYEPAWRPAARNALGVTDTLTVLTVVPEGAAGRAGLAPRDRVVAVNGRALPAGAAGDAALEQELASVREAGSNRLAVGYLRGADPGEALVVLQPGCDYDTRVLVDGELNAWADGRNILVTSTMLRFAGDDELKVLVAHELAHNARGHLAADSVAVPPRRSRRTPGVLRAAYRAADGAGPDSLSFPPEKEWEADYVGLYAMALAGVPLASAPRFWRQLTRADGETTALAATHPAREERFARMERTIAEIEGKRAAGARLLPEEREEPAVASSTPAEPAAPEQAAADSAPPDPVAAYAPAAGNVRSAAELQTDQGLRESLRDLIRLRIAEAYEEVEPGLLVLALTREAWSVTSTEYNLRQLYLAFARATLWPEEVKIELWQRGRLAGRYTRDGLLLEPEPSAR